MTVTPSQFQMLQQLLESAALRHKVISQNVANVETPGYQRLDVAFEEQLAEQLASGDVDPRSVTPEVYQVEGLAQRADGNNVNIDTEMGQLNKNALLYQTYGQVLASKLAIMRSAITGQ